MFENTKCSGFLSDRVGYPISDIVSDIRKDFRICYDASPYHVSLTITIYSDVSETRYFSLHDVSHTHHLYKLQKVFV